RRLAVRARDADEGVAEQAKAELDLAPDGNAASAGGRRQRRLPRYAGALDEQVDSLEQTFLLRPRVHFDAGLGKPPAVDLRRPVEETVAFDLVLAGLETQCHLGEAGFREESLQIRFVEVEHRISWIRVEHLSPFLEALA